MLKIGRKANVLLICFAIVFLFQFIKGEEELCPLTRDESNAKPSCGGDAPTKTEEKEKIE